MAAAELDAPTGFWWRRPVVDDDDDDDDELAARRGGATSPEVCGHICGILMIVSLAATTAFHQVSEPTNCTTRTTDNFKCLFVLQLYISVVRVLMLT